MTRKQREIEQLDRKKNKLSSKKYGITGHWWLIPTILTTQEAEIRRITVRRQSDKQFSRP
jgi:hypothetical protein